MKRKNFMFRFALTCMTITIFPVSIIALCILIPILYSKGEIDVLGIFGTIGYVAIFDLLCFAILVIIGLWVFKVENPERLYCDDTFIDTNQFVKIRKENINCIKARRFIFLYAMDIKAKPWKYISSLTVYFYNKEEMVNFLKENSFLIEYVKKEHLDKLGIKQDIIDIEV